jgi:Dirigent-like protein
MKRLLAVAAVAALIGSVLAAVNASGKPAHRRGHHGSQTIVVHETATFTSQIDNPPSGASGGDAFTFTGNLAGRKSATEQGACTLVTATASQCSITAFFAAGQLVFDGAVPLNQTHFEVPITGGTGRFARARGFADVHVLNATGTEAELVIHVLK